MRKFLAGLISALLLLAAPIAPALGISDVGRPEITRLFASTENGDKFACTGTYIQPYISDFGSWIISAGHCAAADTAVRNASLGIRAKVNWRAVLSSHGEIGTQTVDIALGTAPDVRDGEHKRIWLADATPTDPTRVYIHGFPEGVEAVTTGILVPAGYEAKISLLMLTMEDGYPTLVRKTVAEVLPGTRLMLVKHDRVLGGSSGSPVLDDSDRLIGILWGVISYDKAREIEGVPMQFDGWDLVLMTPVERVHELFKSIGVDG